MLYLVEGCIFGTFTEDLVYIQHLKPILLSFTMKEIVVGASRIMLLVGRSLYRSITALICFLQKAHAICDIPQAWWKYACGLTTLAGTKASIKNTFRHSMLYIMEESLTTEVIFFAVFIYI